MEGEVPREVNTGTHRGRKLDSGAPLDAPGGTGFGLLTAQGVGRRRLWPEGRPRRCRYVARGLLTWPAVAIERIPLTLPPGRSPNRGLRKSTGGAPRLVRSRRWRYVPSANEVLNLSEISLSVRRALVAHLHSAHSTEPRSAVPRGLVVRSAKKTAGKEICPPVHRGTGDHGRRYDELGPAPVAHTRRRGTTDRDR